MLKISTFLFVLCSCFFSAIAGVKMNTIEAETGKLLNGATLVENNESSGGYLVNLSESGQSIQFSGLKSGTNLAIRYSSLSVGTINVAVNSLEALKVNIHSSGKLKDSFLYAIIDIEIPTRRM